jgi:RNA polymerase-binding transcription factor DksA
MISEAEAHVYRQRLLTLMRRLDRDRSQLKDEALRATGGEASGSLSDVPLHLADLGSHSLEEDLTLGLLENEEQLIEEINGALDRMDRNVFGRCESCGQGIAKERLDALPYARHCVTYARVLQREAAP